MSRNNFLQSKDHISVTGPKGFGYTGSIENCEKATNTILWASLSFIGGLTASGIVSDVADFFFGNKKDENKHRRKMEEQELAHKRKMEEEAQKSAIKKQEMALEHEYEMQEATHKSNLKKGEMSLDQEYWRERHPKVEVSSMNSGAEQTTSVAPNMKELKEDLKATKEGFTCVNPPMAEENPAPRTSSNEFKGRSSADLFKRSYATTGKWIVDKYMKAGLLNFVVASSGKGKSIVLTDIARAVDKGVRPAFLPDTCCASVKLKVVYYRLEDFTDELTGKYGEGKVLKESGIEWFLPEDLSEKSLDGFIDHLKGLVSTLTEDTVIFVDPATKLSGYKHEAFIKGVEEAMEAAKRRGITLSVVASIHHDEISDWKALTNDTIKGGDKGIQQAGSVTALRNERTGNEYRFFQCLKEPKGSETPFSGNVVVCKIISESIDENNKNTYLQYVDIKPEAEALPMKPKVQATGTSTSTAPSVGTYPITASAPSVIATPKAAPNQKVTPEMEKRMKEMVARGMKPGKIAKRMKLSEKTIRRYINEWEKQTA